MLLYFIKLKKTLIQDDKYFVSDKKSIFEFN